MPHSVLKCARLINPLSSVCTQQIRSVSRDSAIYDGLWSYDPRRWKAFVGKRDQAYAVNDELSDTPDYRPFPKYSRQGIYKADGSLHRLYKEKHNLPSDALSSPLSSTDRRELQQRRLNLKLVRSHEQREARPASGKYSPTIETPGGTAHSNTSPDFSISVPFSTAASNFIFGTRCVTAALKAKRRKLYHLYYIQKDGPNAYLEILRDPALRTLPCTPLEKHQFHQLIQKTVLSGLPPPRIDNGLCLEASPLPQPPITSLGSYSRSEGNFSFVLDHQNREDQQINGISPFASYNDSYYRAPFLIWLHGVVDVQNVGSIYRTALFFGADGIILSPRETASLSTGVPKSSSGAVEYMPSFKAPLDAASFIQQSQQQGWVFFAAASPNSRSAAKRHKTLLLNEMKSSPALKSPCVLVLGNEDDGLPGQFVKKCDAQISIAGSPLAAPAGLDSLNVGTAAALLCERFLAQPSDDLLSEGSKQFQNSDLFGDLESEDNYGLARGRAV